MNTVHRHVKKTMSEATPTIMRRPVWEERNDMTPSPAYLATLSHACIATSPDGRWLLSTSFSARTVEVYAMVANKIERLATSLPVREEGKINIVVSPDSRSFAIACVDFNAYVYGFIDDDGRLTSLEPKTFRGHLNWVADVCFYHDGLLLATGSFDCTARIWDVATQTQLHVLNAGLGVRSVAFVPNSPCIAAAGGIVYVWNVQNGELVSEFQFQETTFVQVACSANGKWLACGTYRGRVHLMSLEDTTKRTVLCDKNTYTRDLVFSPNSKLLAAAIGRNVLVWSVESKTLHYVFHINTDLRNVAFVGRSNHVLATCEDVVGAQLWDLHTPFRDGVLAALRHPGWARFLLDQDGDHAIATKVARFM